jgi:hypothetical protein
LPTCSGRDCASRAANARMDFLIAEPLPRAELDRWLAVRDVVG